MPAVTRAGTEVDCRGPAPQGPRTFALPRELTIYQVAALRELLLTQVARGISQFDLAGVAECDSAGLQLLMALSRSVECGGQRCRLLKVPAPVREAAATLGIDTLLLAPE